MNLVSKKLLLTLSFCLLNNALYGAAAERAEVKGNAEQQKDGDEEQKRRKANNQRFLELIYADAEFEDIEKIMNDYYDIRHHFDINAANYLGYNALMLLAFTSFPFKDVNRNAKVMKLLLDRNIDVNHQNNGGGDTALFFLLNNTRNEGMLELLLNPKYGVNPHLTKNTGQDALSYIKFLIDLVERSSYRDSLPALQHAKQLLEEYIKKYDNYRILYEKYKKAKVRLAHQAAHKLPAEEDLSANIIEYVPEPYMSFKEFMRRNEILRKREA